jgi:hypothetical protein
VALQLDLQGKETQAEVTDVKAVEVVVVDGVGAEVPSCWESYHASVAWRPSCRRKTVLNLVIS